MSSTLRLTPDALNQQWPVVRIGIERTHQALAKQAVVMSSGCQRVIGLLGRRALPEEEALIFPTCRSIHTWGMQFAIDVVFIDRGWRVVALRPAVNPWRMVLPVWKAWGVIEMAEGAIRRAGLEVGDRLELSCGDA